jgi:hypothetical protein
MATPKKGPRTGTGKVPKTYGQKNGYDLNLVPNWSRQRAKGAKPTPKTRGPSRSKPKKPQVY